MGLESVEKGNIQNLSANEQGYGESFRMIGYTSTSCSMCFRGPRYASTPIKRCMYRSGSRRLSSITRMLIPTLTRLFLVSSTPDGGSHLQHKGEKKAATFYEYMVCIFEDAPVGLKEMEQLRLSAMERTKIMKTTLLCRREISREYGSNWESNDLGKVWRRVIQGTSNW